MAGDRARFGDRWAWPWGSGSASTWNRSRLPWPRLYAYADALIADRRATPRDDCVTSLVQAHADHDRLSQAELRDTLVLLMFGGFDTTRNQLGLAMQAFADHPEQWRLLGQRPDLAPAAVEEVMRVSPTTTWVTREALADLTFDGLAIKAGTTSTCSASQRAPTPGRARTWRLTSPLLAVRRTWPSAGVSITVSVISSRART